VDPKRAVGHRSPQSGQRNQRTRRRLPIRNFTSQSPQKISENQQRSSPFFWVIKCRSRPRLTLESLKHLRIAGPTMHVHDRLLMQATGAL